MKPKNRRSNVKTIEEIREILEDHKEEVSRKYKIREIGIFGSFVRGEQKKRSDVDILVEFEKAIKLAEVFGLKKSSNMGPS